MGMGKHKGRRRKKGCSASPMGQLGVSAPPMGEKDFSAPMGLVDFTLNELKALDDYNPPSDFMTLVLPLDAGGSEAGHNISFTLWYEHPDYPNPWENWEQEEEEEEERQPQHHKEEEGTACCDFDFDIPDMWANSSARQRRKGRWGCLKAAPCKQGQSPDVSTPISSSSLQARTKPRHSTEALDMLKVFKVRLEMYERDERKEPRYLLFKSTANVNELRLPFILHEPYIYYATRCNKDSTMPCYAHFFPDLIQWNTSWVRPTTYEGDLQYLEFFPKLIGATDYSNTKDDVLAKAIAIASTEFEKMLYFQIEIAVEDCIKFHEEKEKMLQRYDVYYFILDEILFKGKDYGSVLKCIKDGRIKLCYNLTEINSIHGESLVRDMLYDIVHITRPQMPTDEMLADFKEWVYERIFEEFQMDYILYAEHLLKKTSMGYAKNLFLLPEVKEVDTLDSVTLSPSEKVKDELILDGNEI